MSPEANPQQANARCAECGAPFRCGSDDAAPCWCARDFPAVLPLPATGAGCLCPACLRRRLDELAAAGR
ncbi:MAG TPA: cysteine-rich CWC family protein [Gammaproteobacteria bacterium]